VEATRVKVTFWFLKVPLSGWPELLNVGFDWSWAQPLKSSQENYSHTEEWEKDISAEAEVRKPAVTGYAGGGPHVVCDADLPNGLQISSSLYSI
jgi:hypothetical protein